MHQAVKNASLTLWQRCQQVLYQGRSPTPELFVYRYVSDQSPSIQFQSAPYVADVEHRQSDEAVQVGRQRRELVVLQVQLAQFCQPPDAALRQALQQVRRYVQLHQVDQLADLGWERAQPIPRQIELCTRMPACHAVFESASAKNI